MQTVTKPRRKSRLTDDERRVRNEESLINGSRCQPNSNDLPVIMEFESRGIPADQVNTFGPDQNVYTYNAWQAKNRQVRKGEKSVTCTVWIPVVVKGDPNAIAESKRKDRIKSRVHYACLFHVSQTDQIGGAREDHPTIDNHFKRNLGNDYIRFYWEWIRFLAIPVILFSVLAIIQWIGGVR